MDIFQDQFNMNTDMSFELQYGKDRIESAL